ncbi:REP-associated tyrosine transposase [Aeromonas media]|uniref:REP-associated tyrosine transposase n=1 Tax=Aeromonas media TaxID=651 RepID=UPI003F4E9CB6
MLLPLQPSSQLSVIASPIWIRLTQKGGCPRFPLPDHLHCILSLPEGDTDFPLRWRLIKSHFSRALPVNERRSQTRLRHGERGIWQRHYWEHLIRDEQDYRHHMDYVHINPLKHGHVTRRAGSHFVNEI